MAFPAVTLQLPLTHTRRFSVAAVDMQAGIRHAYYHTAAAQRGWDLTFDATDAELVTLENFWNDRQGALLSFDFTDPDTSDVVSCHFEGEGLELIYNGPNQTTVKMRVVEDL